MNGEIQYEHDPALEVILNVHATYTDVTGFHEAHEMVRIRPDQTVNETFVLNP
jgi:predicted aminopeptidase